MQVAPELSDRLGQGVTLHKRGRVEEAVAIYREVLDEAPDYADALHLLGLASHQMGRHEKAVELIKQALERDPTNAKYLTNLGTVYDAQGQHENALFAYRQALKYQPDDADTHFNIGVVSGNLGEVQNAIDAFTKATELAPGFAEAFFNLAETHKKKGDVDTAEANYRRSIEAAPEFPKPYINLGPILKERGCLAEAIQVEEKALELEPNSGEAVANLYRFCQLACDWSRLATLNPLLDRITDEVLEAGNPPAESPFLNVLRQVDLERNLAIATAWSKSISTEVLHRVRSRADDRIRLGYISADLYNHATAHLVAELFEIHDRNHFEVFGFDYGPNDGSSIRLRLEQSFDQFLDIGQLSDAEAAQSIGDLEIDIAIDLKGYTQNSRPGILANRPAPVQVSYLGYPGTMGADFIDYILVDPFVVPAEQQEYFSEKLVWLPDCYQVNDRKRPIESHTPARAECGLPESGFVFCCFNSNYKIMPAVFDTWMRLLQQVPGSVLWLLHDNELAESNLRREARARNVEPERLIFAPRENVPAHLSRQRLADLFLDTFPVNAHTTASDALWAGLPLLTCAGHAFAGRVAGSLLRAVGLPELITNNLEEYEALALKIATDPELLRKLRGHLAENRETEPLFDTDRFRRHIEAAFMKMWRMHASGCAPRAFMVEPF